MKIHLLFAVIFFNLMSFTSMAESLEAKPSEVKCGEEEQHQERCYYIAQNLSAQSLITKLNAVLFPSSTLGPSDGYWTAETLRKMSFWLKDETLRGRLIALIPMLDTQEDFKTTPVVLFTVEIYSISDKGLSFLETSVTDAMTGLANAPTGEFHTPTGTMMMNLKIGNTLLASVLGAQATKEEVERLTVYSKLIHNMDGINLSHKTNVYISPPGSGQIKVEEAGVKVGGWVSINREDRDLVKIEGFEFSWGILQKAEDETSAPLVNILSFTNNQFYLNKGISTLLVGSNTTENQNSSNTGLIKFGKKKEKLRSKIMIVTRAEAMSFAEFTDQTRKLSELKLHREFLPEDIRNFPQDQVNLKEVLEALKPYSYFTYSGDRVMGFTLNQKLAREGNIKRNVKVDIMVKGHLFKKKLTSKIRSVENLMLSGLRFDEEIPLNLLDKTELELAIKMETVGSGEKSKAEVGLFYNPETNTFFQ